MEIRRTPHSQWSVVLGRCISAARIHCNQRQNLAEPPRRGQPSLLVQRKCIDSPKLTGYIPLYCCRAFAHVVGWSPVSCGFFGPPTDASITCGVTKSPTVLRTVVHSHRRPGRCAKETQHAKRKARRILCEWVPTTSTCLYLPRTNRPAISRQPVGKCLGLGTSSQELSRLGPAALGNTLHRNIVSAVLPQMRSSH